MLLWLMIGIVVMQRTLAKIVGFITVVFAREISHLFYSFFKERCAVYVKIINILIL